MSDAGKMKSYRGLKTTVGILAVVAITIAAFWYVCCAEAASWHSRFEAAMAKDGRARLADLVDFDWDAVYLIRPYDLTLPEREEIFGADNGGFWWDQSEKYWTIIYRRPPSDPLVVRMKREDWSLARFGRLKTTNKSASLRIVTPDDPRSADCVKDTGRGPCVALE